MHVLRIRYMCIRGVAMMRVPLLVQAQMRTVPQRQRLSRARLVSLPLFEGEVCEWGVGESRFSIVCTDWMFDLKMY